MKQAFSRDVILFAHFKKSNVEVSCFRRRMPTATARTKDYRIPRSFQVREGAAKVCFTDLLSLIYQVGIPVVLVIDSHYFAFETIADLLDFMSKIVTVPVDTYHFR